MASQVQWHLSGDYFENCNCTVVCPCLVSKAAPLTSRPTEGVCDVPLVFHIESGVAMGAPGNTFSDHGMRWDNSGKNGHYAPIRWSNQA
jgi:hypothetical protein